MTHLRSRAGALFACALLLPSTGSPAAQSEGLIHVIESRRDVLSEDVLASLPPDVGRRVLGGAHRLYLLVNPGLRSGANPPGDLPDDLAWALYRSDGTQPAAVYQQLKRVFRDYLELFFDDVSDADGLQSLVQSRVPSRIVLVTADARPRLLEGSDSPVLAVEVEMRLWRVELLERAPYAVKSVELLYADRAEGRAPIPAALTERAAFRTFRAAVIDSLRDQIALSLWGRQRMLAGDWMGVCSDPIGGAPLAEGAPRSEPQAPPEASDAGAASEDSEAEGGGA